MPVSLSGGVAYTKAFYAVGSGQAIDVRALSGFVLWALGRVPDRWYPRKALAAGLQPPWTACEAADPVRHYLTGQLIHLAQFQVFTDFGLLAERMYPDSDEIDIDEEHSDVRCGPLYDAVVRWHFEPEPPPGPGSWDPPVVRMPRMERPG